VQFVHDTSVSPKTLWHEFAHEHATIETLVARHHLSTSTVQRRLDEYQLHQHEPVPRSMVAIIDATRVGYSWILVVYDPKEKESVYACEIPVESTYAYQTAYADLTNKGFTIRGIVSDGRFVALKWLFPGIPIQMCHFHQEQIVTRYLTMKPKLEANIELLELVRTLSRTDEASFIDAFKLWCRTWHDWLQEKSTDPKTGKTFWTHKRVRQARDSIHAHLPYLFTYQKYPELGMLNTTNALDGKFKKAKVARAVHAGLTHARQIKLILSILFSRG
jgi:hypothetical protein